ncbi:hypothetical protein U9M48_041681 [Paspalum notatum var. saurae]|uniref:Neprosin PEP catalytic domain-containing protein n=1 Tax=Paspalum notatum var. saurae TaxID=547442 RepID=A0AAQ3UPB1_PASNO
MLTRHDSCVVLRLNISPVDYKDSNTHFYVEWTVAGPDKDCLNMECHGFLKTSSSITLGDVISPVSNINGKKQYITLRLFKDKLTGDWHVHYGFNGPPQPVGYLPKSLLPKPVEISFGGLVSHRKPQRSPPMGSGRLPATTLAASFSDIKVIDEHGNNTRIDIRWVRQSASKPSLMVFSHFAKTTIEGIDCEN